MTPLNTFAGNPLDRAAVERRDSAWLEDRFAEASTRVLPLWRLNLPIHAADPLRLAWGGPDLSEFANPGTQPVLLGLLDGVAHFAINVAALEDPAPVIERLGASEFSDLRQIAQRMSVTDAGMAAQSKAQIDWHLRHGFCPNCGERTSMHEGGLMRKCEGCGTEHFPRTDPVVIVVVSDGERCLLGRQKMWPPGMYSALAGFVDQGETIEEAVRREVKEETSIEVGEVRYHSTQPWPFPSSLMIGCHADAASTEISIDEHELDQARWFTREEARQALSQPSEHPEFNLPGPMAIAHVIIRAWVEGG